MSQDAFYFTKKQYEKLQGRCVCICGDTRKQHNPDMSCSAPSCLCKKYGRRQKWSRRRVAKDDQKLFESEGEAGQEWYTCMYFNDAADVPESCTNPGDTIAYIEVPLQTVDVTWRTNLLGGFDVAPAAHPLERGCFTTMPLVLCPLHLAVMTKMSIDKR